VQTKLILVFVLGCGRTEDPVPSVPFAPIAIDGAAEMPVIDAAAPSKPPPTGMYQLSTDTNDGCASKKTSSTFEQPLIVFVKHDRGKMLVNIPFVVTPGGGAIARSDMTLEVGAKMQSKTPACTVETEIVEISHDGIRLVRTETCAQPPPTCRRETTLIYTLKKSLCEGPCNATNVHILTDGGVDLKCECP